MTPSQAGARLVHLDIMRMACVVVWITRRGDGRLAENNIILIHNWAAPMLWLISGICWGRSRRPLCAYVSRLAIFFSIGTALNAVSLIIERPGDQWKCCTWNVDRLGNTGFFNVVKHLWFVVGLMLMSSITAPLKALSNASDENRTVRTLWSAVPPIVLTSIVIIMFCATGPEGSLPSFLPDSLQWWFRDTAPVKTIAEAAVCEFMAVCALALKNRGGHVISWVLLIFELGVLVVYRHRRAGMEVLAMHLFVLGFVVDRVGMFGRLWLGRCIAGYWLLVLVACGFISIPFYNGVSDLDQCEHMSTRARWSAVTGILIVAFFCAGDKMSDPFDLFARFPGLNYWVIFLYLVHVAVHRIVPSPFNWWVLFASVVPFALAGNTSRQRRDVVTGAQTEIQLQSSIEICSHKPPEDEIAVIVHDTAVAS